MHDVIVFDKRQGRRLCVWDTKNIPHKETFRKIWIIKPSDIFSEWLNDNVHGKYRIDVVIIDALEYQLNIKKELEDRKKLNTMRGGYETLKDNEVKRFCVSFEDANEAILFKMVWC